MDKMNKPISVVYEEFKQALIDLINNSGLPAFVVEPVLRECTNEVKAAAENQYKSDKYMFEEYLKNNPEDNS